MPAQNPARHQARASAARSCDAHRTGADRDRPAGTCTRAGRGRCAGDRCCACALCGARTQRFFLFSDCAHPRLLTPEPFIWPENQHNLTISGNGRYVFATLPLQAVDIDPLFDNDPSTDAIYLGDIERDMPYPVAPVAPAEDATAPLPLAVRSANRRKASYAF